MKTLKRLNLLVVLVMALALAAPGLTYARLEEGSGMEDRKSVV